MHCFPKAVLQALVTVESKNLNKNDANQRSDLLKESISVKDVHVDEKNRGSDSLKEGWRHGLAPTQLSIEWTQAIQRLFLEGTGEEYFIGSIQSLPVPEWEGNFMLFDSEESTPESMRGLLWTSPFKEDTIRIVSFVLDVGARGKGWGSLVWNLMIDEVLAKGFHNIQLEVRASNQRAISFYRKRGLEIIQELHGYYRQGMGYMMRGKLQHYHPNNDTP
tara:strand:+ start:193 stop:849 length:657 start_codon:yes stop_codon:yes gene_type:complete